MTLQVEVADSKATPNVNVFTYAGRSHRYNKAVPRQRRGADTDAQGPGKALYNALSFPVDRCVRRSASHAGCLFGRHGEAPRVCKFISELAIRESISSFLSERYVVHRHSAIILKDEVL
jgi:hypothetical protein